MNNLAYTACIHIRCKHIDDEITANDVFYKNGFALSTVIISLEQTDITFIFVHKSTYNTTYVYIYWL